MKTNKTRYGLLLHETKNDGGYYHLRFSVVTIGPTAEDRTYFDQYPSGAVLPHYLAIRNPRDRDGDLNLDSLTVISQGNNDDVTRKLYGFEVVYRDVYSVDKAKATRMAHTLSVIDKSFHKQNEKFGYPDTFGAFVARVANAIKADSIVVEKNQGRSSSSYSENEYRFLTIGEGVSEINARVRAWAEPKKDAVEA